MDTNDANPTKDGTHGDAFNLWNTMNIVQLLWDHQRFFLKTLGNIFHGFVWNDVHGTNLKQRCRVLEDKTWNKRATRWWKWTIRWDGWTSTCLHQVKHVHLVNKPFYSTWNRMHIFLHNCLSSWHGHQKINPESFVRLPKTHAQGTYCCSPSHWFDSTWQQNPHAADQQMSLSCHGWEDPNFTGIYIFWKIPWKLGWHVDPVGNLNSC